MTLPTSNALDLDATVKSVISSVGDMKGDNVKIKVVVVSGNSNTVGYVIVRTKIIARGTSGDDFIHLKTSYIKSKVIL